MKVAFVLDKIGFSIPLGLAYLSSALSHNGFEVEVFKIGKNNLGLGELLRYRPEIIGYSVTTGRQREYLRINKQLKERFSFYSVFGGPHPTFFPEIINEDGVDAICRGEAEDALVEFVGAINSYKELPENTKNFWIKKEGKVFKNELRPLIDNLDNLPAPDYRIFLTKFRHLTLLKRREFSAHRGCPYSCSYCFNPAYNHLYRNKGRVHRALTPRRICNVIKELQEITDFKYLHFVDDVFSLDTVWLKNFADIYRDEIGLPFSVNLRLNNCSHEVAEILEYANCFLAYVGVETGNDFLRNAIMARNMGKKTMYKGIRFLKMHGIKVIAENIIGSPQETYQSSVETLRFNSSVKPNFANVSIFTPYPGLPLTKFAIQNNLLCGDFDSIDSIYYRKTNLKFKNNSDINRMLNLRCFFSFLAKHSRLLPLLAPVLCFKHNRFFVFIGDLLDGYYLYKLLPFRFSIKDIVKLFKVYLVFYRN